MENWDLQTPGIGPNLGGAMNEWRPIETAPKDGAFVLVWDEGRIYVAHFRAASLVEKWWVPFDYHGVDPTHWMPLPESPIATEDSSADSK